MSPRIYCGYKLTRANFPLSGFRASLINQQEIRFLGWSREGDFQQQRHESRSSGWDDPTDSSCGSHPSLLNKRFNSAIAEKEAVQCLYCKSNHFMFRCGAFLNKDLANRWEYVTREGICENCMKEYHSLRDWQGMPESSVQKGKEGQAQ